MIALLDRVILDVGPCLSWLWILLSSTFLPIKFLLRNRLIVLWELLTGDSLKRRNFDTDVLTERTSRGDTGRSQTDATEDWHRDCQRTTSSWETDIEHIAPHSSERGQTCPPLAFKPLAHKRLENKFWLCKLPSLTPAPWEPAKLERYPKNDLKAHQDG